MGDGQEVKKTEPNAAPPAAVAAPAVVPAAASAKPRVVPPLLEEAVRKGIRVVVLAEGFEVEGFYKLGTMRVIPGQNGLVAVDKKNKQLPLKGFDDLVALNYDCWKKSRDKSAEFVNPGREWLDEFVRMNLVKRQVIFIPGDD